MARPDELRSMRLRLAIPLAAILVAALLAVLRDGTAIAAPRPDQVLATGDRLLALGTDEQLEQLEKQLLARR